MKKIIIIVIAAAIVTLAAFALAPIALLGCGPKLPEEPPVVSVEAKEALAEGTYKARLLRCVDAYPAGDPRVDECADKVRAAWPRQDGGK